MCVCVGKLLGASFFIFYLFRDENVSKIKRINIKNGGSSEANDSQSNRKKLTDET